MIICEEIEKINNKLIGVNQDISLLMDKLRKEKNINIGLAFDLTFVAQAIANLLGEECLITLKKTYEKSKI